MDRQSPGIAKSDGLESEVDRGSNPDESPSVDYLDRYFIGTAPEGERSYIESYMRRRGIHELLPVIAKPSTLYLAPRISELGKFREIGDFEFASRDRIWSGIVGDLAQNTRAVYPTTSQTEDEKISGSITAFRTRFSTRFLSVGSVFALAIVATGVWLGVKGNTVHKAPEYAGQEIQGIKTVATTHGQRVNYHLPDGSSVLLAPGSTLRYSETFGLNNRAVTLEGEALFTVTQDGGIPFIVTSGSASVRVLGTAFTVRRYSRDTATSVVVAEGKVSVGQDILTSGTSMVMKDNGEVHIERAADISSELAWTNGKLVFRRTNFGEVIYQLERWLDISIAIEDRTLLNRQITGAFMVSEPESTIYSIAAILNARVIQNGRNFSFVPSL